MTNAPKVTVWLKLDPDQHALLLAFARGENRSKANAAEEILRRSLSHWDRRRRTSARHADTVDRLLNQEEVPAR